MIVDLPVLWVGMRLAMDSLVGIVGTDVGKESLSMNYYVIGRYIIRYDCGNNDRTSVSQTTKDHLRTSHPTYIPILSNSLAM